MFDCPVRIGLAEKCYASGTSSIECVKLRPPKDAPTCVLPRLVSLSGRIQIGCHDRAKRFDSRFLCTYDPDAQREKRVRLAHQPLAFLYFQSTLFYEERLIITNSPSRTIGILAITPSLTLTTLVS